MRNRARKSRPVAMKTDHLPLSFCTVCGKRIPFAYKGGTWHGLACGRKCYWRLEYRYSVMVVGSAYDLEKENEIIREIDDT